jgi:hypothetical protein
MQQQTIFKQRQSYCQHGQEVGECEECYWKYMSIMKDIDAY